jgi:hypothetical protein
MVAEADLTRPCPCPSKGQSNHIEETSPMIIPPLNSLLHAEVKREMDAGEERVA